MHSITTARNKNIVRIKQKYCAFARSAEAVVNLKIVFLDEEYRDEKVLGL
jgi:hypothetical protein